MTSAWSQLEQLLTCCVCLDRFRNPKLLPCQHTFCGEPCLEGLVDYARRQIKCPECRAEHRIPYNGVQSFPNNVTLARFLDLHRGITGEEPEPLPSQMDRCGVCSEKAFCERCSHCDKKVCEECKEAHLDILRREISRINNQVRRGLTKLTEHSTQTERNSEKLQLNHKQIREEITESVRRFIKDLKDKEAKLLHDLDEYTQSETKSVEKLKEDLEQEVTNLTSNCELAEKHITENDEWTDSELVEYKEIFMKTLDFLRNLDPDTSDFARKIKFQYKTDVDILRRTLIDFGELKITTPNMLISPSESSSNLSLPNQNNLMRSQSDHRLTAQFQQRKQPESRFLDVSNSQSRLAAMTHSDSERDSRLERNSSPTRRITDRYTRYGVNRRDVDDDRDTRSRFLRDTDYSRNWPRPSDSEDTITPTTQFRSRFMRERNNQQDYSFDDSHDSDVGSSHRSVRFEEPTTQPRPKVFETEEAARGPLSGVIKLTDSPHVMERLHQNEVRQKLKEAEAQNPPAFTPTPAPPVSTPVPPQPRRTPSRQVSEDEIEKQKKANQVAAAANATPAPSVPQPPIPKVPQSSPIVPESPTRIINRRVTTLQKEDERTNRYSSDSSRRGSDSSVTVDDSQMDEESGDTSGIARLARRRTNNEDIDSNSRAPVTRQTSNPRSVRSPLGKNLSLTHTEANDVNNDNKNIVRHTIGSDKKDSRTISTDIESQSSDSNTSNESSGESDSESDEEEAGAPTSAVIGSSSNNRSIGSTALTDTQHSAQARKDNLNTISKTDVPTYGGSGRFSRQSTLSDDSNTGSIFKNRKTSSEMLKKDEEAIPSYQSKRSLSRSATLEEDANDDYSNASSTSAYSRFLGRNRAGASLVANKDDTLTDDSKYSYTRRSDKFGSSNTPSTASSYRSRLAKSKSSHTIAANDESDEENVNPISPTYKSRFPDISLANRKTSRSGYTYRTREQSPPPEEEAGSVAQYLINKYGTKSSSSKTDPSKSSILKSKSSHVLYGRSISSSDEETSTASLPRRSSRDNDITPFSSAIKTSSYGLTYPRQMFMQKKKMMMRIGSRGTEPGCFTWPRGVTTGPDNNIVVADSSNHRVQVFDSTGRFMFEFGSYGSGDGEFDCLASVAVNRIGQFIVSDRYNHRIQLFDPSGRFLRSFGSEGRSDGRFSYPWGITTDALGFIYVCDKENHRIQVFQSDGTFVGKFGTIGSRTGMLEHPHYVTVSNTNRVIISDSNNHRIQIFDVNGRALSSFGTEGSGDGQFKFPRGVAIDDQGFIIVGDSGNNRVQIFNPDGTFLKSFGTWGSGDGEFKGLEGLAISSTGNILVCDRENHRIQIF